MDELGNEFLHTGLTFVILKAFLFRCLNYGPPTALR